MTRRYVGAWLVVCWSCLCGLRSIRVFLSPSLWPPGLDPDRRLGINYYVYHYAAEAALAGEDVYAAPPPGWPARAGDLYTYQYPPITVLAYVPFTALEPFAGFLVHTLLTLVACAATAWAVVVLAERTGRSLGRVDVGAVALFVAISYHSTPTIHFGNVNLLLAAALALGLLALERGRETTAGVAFGAVALVKIFPALVGLYLLRVRAWRAVLAATATGLGGLLASAAVFGPGSLRRFVEHVLVERTDAAAFVGGFPPDGRYYVTVRRPLSHVLWTVVPDADPGVLTALSVLVLAPPVAYCYLDLEGAVDRLVALHATLTASILVIPSLRLYIVFLFPTFVPLLYAWHRDRVGALFVAGGLLAGTSGEPESLLETVSAAPGPLAAVGEAVFTFGTLQLYGLLAMLAACVAYERRRGVGLEEALEIGRTARRALPGGPPTK